MLNRPTASTPATPNEGCVVTVIAFAGLGFLAATGVGYAIISWFA